MSNTLTVTPPEGSHFEWDEVSTEKGTKSLGPVPLLTWDSVTAAYEFYGEEGLKNVLNGTSIRVSMQAVARRMKIAGKSDDEIAKTQIEFRPGKREVGQSTPASRAASAARKASEKVDGDTIQALLAKIASGEITQDQLNALAGAQ